MTWLKASDEIPQIYETGGLPYTPSDVLVDRRLSDLFGPAPQPKPAPPASSDRGPTVWVVKQASGGTLRVLAEDHYTYARPEGTELRFFNGDGEDGRHPVATIRAGSWHWCVAEAALEPKEGQS